MRWMPMFVLAACCVGGSCDSTGPLPTRHLAIMGGTGQTDTVGQTLPIPYDVLVRDQDGAPLAGVAVPWTVVSGGGSFSSADAVTDANGRARATRVLGPATGVHVSRVEIPGAIEIATFTTIAVADTPALALKTVGDRQTADAGATLGPYSVRVTDAFGNNKSSVIVQFTARGGSVTAASVPTAGNGVASTTHTLSTAPGPDTVMAVVPATGDTLYFVSFAVGAIPIVAQVPVPASYGLHDTYVRDGIAFACVWNSGVIIFDVGDGRAGGTPAVPVSINIFLPNDNAVPGGRQVHNAWWFYNPVLNEKRYLFIGQEGPGAIGSNSSGDIHVVDVSDFQNPVEVAFYHLAGAGVHNFWMDEPAQVLYAAYYNGGVVALDVSGTLTGDLASREIARIQPGGAGNTYTWGVQLHTNGSLYAVDMLSGVWQLQRTGGTFSVAGGGNNVPERFGSDLWVHGDYLYSGTWGTRAGNPGNTLKIWHLSATGTPSLVGSIVTPNISTVSDVQVSNDGQVLVFSAEGGSGAGLYVYGLGDPQNPVLMGRSTGLSLHTATISDIGGRRYVFAAKNPSLPAMVVFDITALAP